MPTQLHFEVEDAADAKAVVAKSWRNPMYYTAPFILICELCERLAFYGLSTNLSNYLRFELGYSVSSTASQLSIWQGTCYMTPLIGAYLADAHLGRFVVIGIFSTIYFIGMALLTLTRLIPGLVPEGGGVPATGAQIAVFWISMYIVALGTGGIKPNVSAFGADQFNPDDPREAKLIGSFFSLFYVSINIGSLIASTALVYVQENVSWALGFGIPCAAMGLSVIVFFLASGRYNKRPSVGNPYKEMFGTLACAYQKRKLQMPVDINELYELEDSFYIESKIHRMPLTPGQQYLNKAAIQGLEGTPVKTVTQCEELKQLGRLLPIAIVAIVYQCIYSQMFALFVIQGTTMTAGFVDAAMMTTWDIIGVLVGMAIYERFLNPWLSKRMKWTLLRRIGVGYAIAAFAMGCGALTEYIRLRQIWSLGMTNTDEPAPMSIWWQTPMYFIIGLSEVFAMSGFYNFFYVEAPDTLVSFTMAIQLLTMALGAYLSSFLVFVVGKITGTPGWLPPAGYYSNQGRLDLFFTTLFVMQVLAIGVHILVAMRYKEKQVIEWPVSMGHGEDMVNTDMEDKLPVSSSLRPFTTDTTRNSANANATSYQAVPTGEREVTPTV